MPVQSWSKAVRSAMEGTGFAIPTTVGSVGLLYFKIGGAFLAPALFAAMVGTMLVLVLTSRNGRPMMFAVRVLEVTMLAVFLDQFILKMPGWNFSDTPIHRLLLLIAVCVGSAALLPLFYVFRLQRFARMMPAPVFAGFSSAVGLTLLWSQSRVLWASVPQDGPWAVVIAGVVAVAAVATQLRWRALPAGVMGLVAGTAASLLLSGLGVHTLATVSAATASLVPPAVLVHWPDLFAPGVRTLAILQDVFLASLTLASVVFLNAVVAEEMLSQLDDAVPRSSSDSARYCAAQLAAALLGSPPLTPTPAASRAAFQAGGLGYRSMLLAALCVFAVYASNLLHLVALASIVGLLLFDAWSSFDRTSLHQLREWMHGRVPDLAHKEDLATVVAVMLATAVFNTIAGIVIGVFAGLLLYALRNGKRLVRAVADGSSVRSRCSRSQGDTQLLMTRAATIKYLELEGALFFGAVGTLQKQMRNLTSAGGYLVVNCSQVISTDSTVANALAKMVRQAQTSGAQVAICGVSGAGNGLRSAMERAGLAKVIYPDADRALEWAENQVIAAHTTSAATAQSIGMNSLPLFRGIEDAARTAIEAAFVEKSYRNGQTVFAAGERGDDLMVVLRGSVNIMMLHATGSDLRLAGMRPGSTLGEMGFLDASPRSANAVAAGDLVVAILSRAHFEALAQEWPHAAQRLLSNLALDLAFRLRSTNQIALAQMR